MFPDMADNSLSERQLEVRTRSEREYYGFYSEFRGEYDHLLWTIAAVQAHILPRLKAES